MRDRALVPADTTAAPNFPRPGSRSRRREAGRIVHEAIVEEISYHALLAHLPIGAIQALLEQATRDTELVQCEQIQFFRASGQMSAVLPGDERQQDEGPLSGAAPSGHRLWRCWMGCLYRIIEDWKGD